MPMITNNADYIIPDGAKYDIAYNANGTVNYITYYVGAKTFRVTFTYSGTAITAASLPIMQ